MTDETSAGDYGRFDRLAEEFVERFRRGERAGLQEFVDRCPEMEEEIRDLFPALVEVEQAERALDDRTDALAHPPSSSAPPDQLGDYRILREIGRGGMGVVYEAEQLSLGRRVALKVLPRTMKQDAIAQMRFRREARSAARLHHTNIVPVFEVGQDGDVVYYAMQFIQGQGLDLVVEELKRLRDHSRGTDVRPSRSPSEAGADLAPPAPTLATGPSPRGDGTERMARFLLTGQFGPVETRGPAPGSRDDATQGFEAALVERNETEKAGPSTDVRSSSPSLAPEVRAGAWSTSGGSTVLPGGAPLSGSESSGRRQPFFRSVAEIGRQAASGLAHAHGRGIVHRDIKPSNLLLDAAGVVWITDFGLAKSGDESLTASGDILGTLRYMAPERFRGEGDSRADIYALGVTLYELMTLRPTFDSPDRLRLIQQVKDQEPPRPRSLDPRIPRDLETIVLKSIEKDPRRRYASADAMGEDLRRFLDGEPIRARQVGEVEKAYKWARRRPAIAGLMLLAVASMVVGTAVSALFAIRANEKAETATRAEVRARGSEVDAKFARERAVAERDNSRKLSAGLAFDRGLALAEEGQPDRGLHWMLEALKTSTEDQADFRLMVRRNLASWLAATHEPTMILEPGSSEASSDRVGFSPDGRAFVVSGSQPDPKSPLSLRDTSTGRILATYPGAVTPVAFRPDGRVLIVGWEDQRHLRAIDLTTGLPLWTALIPEEQARAITFFAGGTEMFVGLIYDPHKTQWGQVWDAVAGRPIGPILEGAGFLAPDGRIVCFEKGPAGRSVVSLADRSGGNRVEIFREPGKQVYEVALAPDMKSLWASTFESWAYRLVRTSGRLWELAGRRPIGPILDKTATLWYCPAGDRTLSEANGVVVVRDSTTGRALGSPLSEANVGHYFDRSPDGRTVSIRSSLQGTIRFWKLSPNAVPSTAARGSGEDALDEADPLRKRLALVVDPHPRLAPGGRVFARWHQGTGDRATVQFSDPTDGRPIGRPARHRYPAIRCLAFSPEGRSFATGSDPETLIGEVRLYDSATGLLRVPPMLHTNYVSALAFRPDGKVLAAGDYHGLVRLWDTATGREIGKPLAQGAIVWSLAFSPDGKTLAVGHHFEHAGKPGVMLWDLEKGRPIGELLRHQHAVTQVTFRPDGKALAATDAYEVRLWDVAGSRAIGDPLVGESAVTFHPDGQAFLTAGKDGSIRVRDASTGAFLAPIPGGSSQARCLAYRGDGRLIVAGLEDGTVRLLDPLAARQVGPPRSLRTPISDVAFTADGRSFVAVDELGGSRTWPVPEPLGVEDPGELSLRIEARTGHRMTTGPAVLPLDWEEWAERLERVATLDAPRTSVDDPSWHEPLILEAEEKGNTFAALWHLDRLIAARPGDWTLFARRGRVRSGSGDFERASKDLEEAERLGSRERVLDWQAQCSSDAEEAGRWSEALWHLDRLILARPDDWNLFHERSVVQGQLGRESERLADLACAIERGGDASLVLPVAETLARSGRWAEAARMLAACGRRDTIDPAMGQAWAVACLASGDRAGFLEARSTVLARLDGSPRFVAMLFGLVSTLALGSGEADDTSALVKGLEARRAGLPSEPNPYYHLFSNMLGGLHLRAGRLDLAIARLDEGLAATGEYGEIPTDWALLALAHARKGDRAKARRNLDRLAAWDPSKEKASSWDVEEIGLLRREAEGLLLDPPFPDDPFER